MKQKAYAGQSTAIPRAQIVQPVQINPGQNRREFKSAILNANMSDFKDTVLTLDPEEIFSYINKILSRLIPISERYGGEIDKISEAGISALFPISTRDALIAAISMCQEFVGGRPGTQLQDISVGICYGSIVSGVVGSGKTFTTLNLSEYSDVCGFLRSIARQYNSRILVTEGYANTVEDFSVRFNSRILGRIYMKSLNAYENIYDVFDGDSIDIRNNKRKTKLMFEKAVNLFIRKDYNEARLHFVEVLKADRNDSAAKEYLFLCDKCSNSESGYDSRTYLEMC